MKQAERVTFGGAGLDRAAELRGRSSALREEPGARFLPVWRGKPLFLAGGAEPGWLKRSHPMFSHATEEVFLGQDEGSPRFAVDISGWEPEDIPDTLGAFFDPSVQSHPDLQEDGGFCELRGVMTLLDASSAELVATAKALLSWHSTHRFCARCGAATAASEAGWQRTCGSCGAHHFPRTDPVVIMLILHGNDVLVGRSPGWPDGMYSLLAGFIEPGETIEAAVRREVMEESGICVGQVDYLASQPWPFPSSLMIGCLGEARTRDITLDPVELDDARWISREEMTEIYAGRNPNIHAARKGSIANFLIGRWLEDRLE